MSGLTLTPALSLAAQGVSTIMQSADQRRAAGETEAITNYNIAVAESSAKSSEAASQQEANEIRRQARLKESRALALAAASGGSALDPDVMSIISGFEEEGDLAARTALYEGSEDARVKRMRAQGIAYEGGSRARRLRNQSTSTILSNTGSMLYKYGQFMN